MRPRADGDGCTTPSASTAPSTSSSPSATVAASHATEATATQAQRKHTTFVACAAVVLDTGRAGPNRLPAGRVPAGPAARHGEEVEGCAAALVRAHGHAARDPGLPGPLLPASSGHGRRQQRRLVAQTQQGSAAPSTETQRRDTAVKESVLTAAAQWPARYTQVRRGRRLLARAVLTRHECSLVISQQWWSFSHRTEVW